MTTGTTFFTIYAQDPLGPQMKRIREGKKFRIMTMAKALEHTPSYLRTFENNYHGNTHTWGLVFKYLKFFGISHVLLDIYNHAPDHFKFDF